MTLNPLWPPQTSQSPSVQTWSKWNQTTLILIFTILESLYPPFWSLEWSCSPFKGEGSAWWGTLVGNLFLFAADLTLMCCWFSRAERQEAFQHEGNGGSDEPRESSGRTDEEGTEAWEGEAMIDVMLGEDKTSRRMKRSNWRHGLHVLFRPTFGSFSKTWNRNTLDPLTLKVLNYTNPTPQSAQNTCTLLTCAHTDAHLSVC